MCPHSRHDFRSRFFSSLGICLRFQTKTSICSLPRVWVNILNCRQNTRPTRRRQNHLRFKLQSVECVRSWMLERCSIVAAFFPLNSFRQFLIKHTTKSNALQPDECWFQVNNIIHSSDDLLRLSDRLYLNRSGGIHLNNFSSQRSVQVAFFDWRGSTIIAFSDTCHLHVRSFSGNVYRNAGIMSVELQRLSFRSIEQHSLSFIQPATIN